MELLIPAVLLITVLVPVHAYFGLYIIQRNIIFTDLAVGQMAAFGAAISIVYFEEGYEYLFSVVFALLTAAVIGFVHSKNNRFQEGFIGLIYGLGGSGVFLVMSRSAHGMEEINKLLAYDILFTSYKDVVEVVVVYSLILIFLFVYNRLNLSYTLKNLLFFSVFAVVVTTSVKHAGVLVVFSMLVAPALVILNILKKESILFASLIGLVVCITAIFMSYQFDLPTGYTIVFLLALSGIISVILRP